MTLQPQAHSSDRPTAISFTKTYSFRLLRVHEMGQTKMHRNLHFETPKFKKKFWRGGTRSIPMGKECNTNSLPVPYPLLS